MEISLFKAQAINNINKSIVIVKCDFDKFKHYLNKWQKEVLIKQ